MSSNLKANYYGFATGATNYIYLLYSAARLK